MAVPLIHTPKKPRMHQEATDSSTCHSRLDPVYCDLTQLEDHPPTPNKNGSYGIEGEVRMPYFWVRMPDVL